MKNRIFWQVPLLALALAGCLPEGGDDDPDPGPNGGSLAAGGTSGRISSSRCPPALMAL